MVKYRARSFIQIVNIVGALALINIAYLMSYIIRFFGMPPIKNFQPYLIIAPFITLAALIFLGIYEMYSNIRKTKSEIISSVFCIVFLISVSSIAISYFFGKFAFPRTVFLLSSLLQLPLMVIWFWLMRRVERAVHGTKYAVIFGNYSECAEVCFKIENNSQGIFHVKGIVTDNGVSNQVSDTMVEVLGNYDNFKNKIQFSEDHVIIICSSLQHEVKQDIIRFCLENNISLFVVPEVYEILVAQSRVVQMGDAMLFGIDGLQIDLEYRFIKRLMDLVIAGLGLTFAAFPMLLIMLAIKVDSAGPVFYTQERVGRNGKAFRLYKFRTMVQDAEKSTGPVLATANDNRITRLGRFLRASRLDELPQLINVLKGEMSLVGPRPERQHFVDQFSQAIPHYIYRTHVKAGITGLAQVSGRYSTTPQDKLRFDLLYAKTYSPLSDLRIMFQTLKVIFMKDKSS